MAKFFDRNIDVRGRRARFVTGLVLLVAAIVAAFEIWWLAVILGVAAVFTFFEAARGWCVMRACLSRRGSVAKADGIKTKL